jgi:hypothetical protein
MWRECGEVVGVFLLCYVGGCWLWVRVRVGEIFDAVNAEWEICQRRERGGGGGGARVDSVCCGSIGSGLRERSGRKYVELERAGPSELRGRMVTRDRPYLTNKQSANYAYIYTHREIMVTYVEGLIPPRLSS